MGDKSTNRFDVWVAAVPLISIAFTSIMTGLNKLDGNLQIVAWSVSSCLLTGFISWLWFKSKLRKIKIKVIRENDLLWKGVLDKKGIDLHGDFLQAVEFSIKAFDGHPSHIRYDEMVSGAKYEFKYKKNKVKESLFRDILVNTLQCYVDVTIQYIEDLVTVYDAEGDIEDNLLRVITSGAYKSLGDGIAYYYKASDRDYSDSDKATLRKALTIVLTMRNALSSYIKKSLDDVVMDNSLYGNLGFKVSNILDKFLMEACFLRVTIEGEIENINGELADCIWNDKKVGR
jgi:hypothetical protein